MPVLGKTPDVSLTSEALHTRRSSWVPSEPLYKHLTALLGLSGEKNLLATHLLSAPGLPP